MAEGPANQQQQGKEGSQGRLAAEDLSLIDAALEDEGKTDDELWDEFEKSERAGLNGAASGDVADVDASADDASEDDTDETAAREDDSGSDESKSAAGEDASPDGDQGQDDQGAEGNQADDSDDLWANASPEQRAAHEAAEAQIAQLQRSQDGYRRNLSGLNRRLKELEDALEAKKGQGADSSDDESAESDEIKTLRSEYPEVANPLLSEIQKRDEKIARLEKEMDAVGMDRRQDAIAEQTALLNEQHPDWQTVAADPKFEEWLDSQPRHIGEAARRNATQIVDAAEAADVVGRFKAFRQEQGQPTRDEPRNGQQAGSGTGNALSGKRRRQLDSSASSRSKGPGVASGIPEDADEETIWKMYDEQDRREAARA